MRWEALQKRLEAVQERRRDREKETSRRMQAADRHNQARERRKVTYLWCNCLVFITNDGIFLRRLENTDPFRAVWSVRRTPSTKHTS